MASPIANRRDEKDCQLKEGELIADNLSQRDTSCRFKERGFLTKLVMLEIHTILAVMSKQ